MANLVTKQEYLLWENDRTKLIELYNTVYSSENFTKEHKEIILKAFSLIVVGKDNVVNMKELITCCDSFAPKIDCGQLIIIPIHRALQNAEMVHGSTIRKIIVLGQLELFALQRAKTSVLWYRNVSTPFRGEYQNAHILASLDRSCIKAGIYSSTNVTDYNLDTRI